jgi:hypothetical protein
MKNKFYLFLYLFFVLITLSSAYNYYSYKKGIFVEKSILTLNDELLKEYKTSFDTKRTFGYIWGLKDVVQDEQNKNIKDKNDTIEVVQKEQELCIEKNCYRFLGVYFKKQKAYVSFYSKNFKKGIADFTVNEMLQKPFFIKAIKHNKLSIADANNSREWQFTLFDVNVTKYKPKDINETDF